MFGTNSNATKIGSKFPIAIDVLCKFKGITYEKKGKDNTHALVLHFITKTGAILDEAMFVFTKDSVKRFADETPQKAYDRKCREYSNKITHVLSMFCTPEELETDQMFSTLAEYMKYTIALLKDKDLNKPLYLKTQYNKDGFARLPYTAEVPFLQHAQDSEGKPVKCTLFYSAKEIKENQKYLATVPVASGEETDNTNNRFDSNEAEEEPQDQGPNSQEDTPDWVNNNNIDQQDPQDQGAGENNDEKW